MSSLNKACIIGNLGKDPEIRSTQHGDKVANMSVATAESWRDKQTGEKRERTEWHRITIWGPLVDVAEKYLRKGSKVYLEGKIQTRKWQAQDGSDRYSTEIVLQGFDAKLVMLGDKQGGTDTHEPHPGAQGGQGGGDLDDEIPF